MRFSSTSQRLEFKRGIGPALCAVGEVSTLQKWQKVIMMAYILILIHTLNSIVNSKKNVDYKEVAVPAPHESCNGLLLTE